MVKTKIKTVKTKNPMITIEEAAAKISELQKIIREQHKVVDSNFNELFYLLYKDVEKDLGQYIKLSQKKMKLNFECIETFEIIFNLGYCNIEYDWHSNIKYKKKEDAKNVKRLEFGSDTDIRGIQSIPEVKKYFAIINPIKQRILGKIKVYLKPIVS